MYWLGIWQTKVRLRPCSCCLGLFSAGSRAMETRDFSAPTLPSSLQHCGCQEVAEEVAGLHVSGFRNKIPNCGFFISGSQVESCILELNSSVVAS